MNIFRKESINKYLAQDHKFSKTLTAKDLISLGVGAVIGTGIFILPGTVAANYATRCDPVILTCCISLCS